MGLIHMDSTLQRFWNSHSIDWMAPKGLLWGTINPPSEDFLWSCRPTECHRKGALL